MELINNIKTDSLDILNVLIAEEEFGLSSLNKLSRDKMKFLINKLGGVIPCLKLISSKYEKVFDSYIKQNMNVKSVACLKNIEFDIQSVERILGKCQKHLQIIYTYNLYNNKDSEEYLSKEYDNLFNYEYIKSRCNKFLDKKIQSINYMSDRTDKSNRDRKELKEFLLYIYNNYTDDTTAIADLQIRYSKERADRLKNPLKFSYVQQADVFAKENFIEANLKYLLKEIQNKKSPKSIKDIIKYKSDSIGYIDPVKKDEQISNIIQYVKKWIDILNEIYGYDFYIIEGVKESIA
jgi:hypothetical protein